ncbi:MAG: (2Fe-2S)-binding protein [Chloroflexi bacterium]|nr:(2Fe-2S)-binding protein [Chloroflexota bacterium]MBV9134937.1 (2Fe-2S)-binding protein [Chloroflexota bacterium]MBV9894742.1 (2Fe-2S)-binding protein [Chloroflexota bacterium]
MCSLTYNAVTVPGLRAITLIVNGVPMTTAVEPRRSLLDCLREDLHLHGTHVGCEHGVCGCCNVILDGEVVRSCLLLAAQADGSAITTVEGLETAGGLSPLQEAFCQFHALQCGYCTPGMLITLTGLLQHNASPSEQELLEAISGNLCRCTGYQQILDAARSVIARP